jgi:SAM-dependent methyltransferase
VAWPRRVRREWPFIERILASAPSKRVLDLGCGSGEHTRFLANTGFSALGIDASRRALEKAREPGVPDGARFVEGRIEEVGALAEGRYGAAICLGNTLPHLRCVDSMSQLLQGLRRRLLPGAPFVLQILNYDRILDRQERFLPLSFQDDESEGQIVFLRLMTPRRDGTVVFTPSTLRYRPEAEPALEVLSTKRVDLKGWRRRELEPLLEKARFGTRESFGGFDGSAFDPATSRDLILVAR